MSSPDLLPEDIRSRVRVAESGCWMWTGAKAGSNTKYGVYSFPDRQRYIHRYAYEFYVGPIPAELEIDHLCKKVLCLNPEHLEVVTHQENMRRVRLDVCRRGTHDLTVPGATRWDAQGRRRGCIQCKRDKSLAYFYAHRG
jgi:hypothetical protein